MITAAAPAENPTIFSPQRYTDIFSPFHFPYLSLVSRSPPASAPSPSITTKKREREAVMELISILPLPVPTFFFHFIFFSSRLPIPPLPRLFLLLFFAQDEEKSERKWRHLQMHLCLKILQFCSTRSEADVYSKKNCMYF